MAFQSHCLRILIHQREKCERNLKWDNGSGKVLNMEEEANQKSWNNFIKIFHPTKITKQVTENRGVMCVWGGAQNRREIKILAAASRLVREL